MHESHSFHLRHAAECLKRCAPAMLRGLVCGLLLVQAATAFAASASERHGRSAVVTKVSDGDTLWARELLASGAPKGRAFKLRLQGIDAPELCQPGGQQARDALSKRLLGQQVKWERRATDDYGRGIVVIEHRGEDVARWMVRQGHAWTYRYRGRTAFDSEQRQAQRERIGLWRDAKAMEPRQWRRSKGPCSASSGSRQ